MGASTSTLSSVDVASQPHIVVVGGGPAGMACVRKLVARGARRVTLVDRNEYFEVPYAALREFAAPASLPAPSRRRFDNDLIAGDAGVRFVHGDVARIERGSVVMKKKTSSTSSEQQENTAGKKQKKKEKKKKKQEKQNDDGDDGDGDGESIDYDYLVLALGASYRQFDAARPSSAASRTLDGRVEEMRAWTERLRAARSVVVVGGGTVGVELAGEIAFEFPDKSVQLVHGNARLLNECTADTAAVAERQLRKLGVQVVLNTKVSFADDGTLLGVDASTPVNADADLVLRSIGMQPNTQLFERNAAFPDVLDARHRLRVNAALQLHGTTNVFAVGDCADVGEAKRGVSAIAQGTHAARNIVTACVDVANASTSSSSKAATPTTPVAYTPESDKGEHTVTLLTVGRKKGVLNAPFGTTSLGPLVGFKQKDLFVERTWETLAVARPKKQPK